MGENIKDFLRQSANDSGIELTENMLEKFQKYHEALIETNRTLNLTAITDRKEIVLKHYMDSIFITKFYDLSGTSVIDIGTGAGFPGIPLAILYPETRFVLLDSLKKRLHFIETVLEQCAITNVELLHGRAEDFGREARYREQFDFCVSRAVAALPVLLELCTPFVKVGGKFISYKSERLKEELPMAEHAMKELNCHVSVQHEYELPEIKAFRMYAVFEKEKPVPKKYPRQAGKPKRNPL